MEKIKAEMVNEIEMKSDYDFEAEVIVKVKNKVYSIVIDPERQYRVPEGQEPGVKIRFTDNSIPSTFEELEIEVDYSDIIAEWRRLVPVWKKEKEEKRIEERKESYKNSWIHNAKKEIEALNEGVTASIISEQDYIDSSRVCSKVMSISFKDYTTELCFEDVCSDRHSKNMKYTIAGSITDYKRRGYQKLSSLVKKFKELVDDSIEKEERKNKTEMKKQNLCDTLLDIEFEGCAVKIDTHHHQTYGSYNRRNYIEDGFELRISWTGGGFTSITREGESFSAPILSKNVDLETLKRYIAHIKSFSVEGE